MIELCTLASSLSLLFGLVLKFNLRVSFDLSFGLYDCLVCSFFDENVKVKIRLVRPCSISTRIHYSRIQYSSFTAVCTLKLSMKLVEHKIKNLKAHNHNQTIDKIKLCSR